MPLTLVRRAGVDTLGKLEAAGMQRFREAGVLLGHGERLGAIYLYGYAIEISLKVAYYRVIGLVPSSVIDRRTAENEIRAMRLLPKHSASGGPQPGHHLVGWARLLEQTRAATPTPLDAAVAIRMHQYVDDVFNCWLELLRYRGNRPYDDEVTVVRVAATWFRSNAKRLWR